jgi:hypothetical protein
LLKRHRLYSTDLQKLAASLTDSSATCTSAASPALDVPTRIALHVRRLVAQLEAAVRKEISGAPNRIEAPIAAAQAARNGWPLRSR